MGIRGSDQVGDWEWKSEVVIGVGIGSGDQR